jgi:4-diphosphocytidyl-2-C-methyl-D-erythritol kinase
VINFPNAKINFGLSITGKRQDGYHNLETVFYPIPLQDALELVTSPTGIGVEFNQSGLIIESPPENNLCVKAYELLKKDFPAIPAIKMHLHKLIPMGAGLGGGSSDAAFTLILLNRKFNLGLSEKQLVDYALQLGSDCPFFIKNQPAFASGRGEILEPVNLNLSGYKIVLVNPGIHISTREAFSMIKPSADRQNLKDLIQLPVENWRGKLINGFEAPVSAKFPEIKNIIDNLYQLGAIYASMTGSGSSVYGIFEKAQTIELDFPSDYFVRII